MLWWSIERGLSVQATPFSLCAQRGGGLKQSKKEVGTTGWGSIENKEKRAVAIQKFIKKKILRRGEEENRIAHICK